MRNEHLNPWDRQEGEGAKAYEAFCVYRDLGDGRSIQKVCIECAKTRNIISRWANAYDWRDRADAWDRSIIEEARQKAVKAKAELLKDSLKIGQMMYKRLSMALQEKDLEKTSTRSLVDGIEKGIMLSLNALKETIGEKKGAENDSGITFTFSRKEGNDD